MSELVPCPLCNSKRLWTIRIHPKRWIFTKYYIECSRCHCCGVSVIGKRRAEKFWNKKVEYVNAIKEKYPRMFGGEFYGK